MWYSKSLASLSLLAAISVSECGDRHFLGGSHTEQATSPFNVMDSTAMIYTDPAAASPVYDHPLRWVGFPGHFIGMVSDYVLNRPIYGGASLIPRWYGYTAEDARLHELRSSKHSDAPGKD